MKNIEENPRNLLLELYQAGLQAVHGTALTRHWLSTLETAAPVHAIAIGKAAPAMLAGLDALPPGRLAGTLGITRTGYLPDAAGTDPDIEWIEAGHPLPDASSLRAGERLLGFIEALPRTAEVLVLISGGASSLVEVPVAGMDLEDLRRLNAWLLASGLDIGAMNVVRKAVSRIKGGRLACRLEARRVHCALLSDVPDAAPSNIGSGLLVPDTSPPLPLEDLPDWARGWIEAAEPAPAAGSPCFDHIDCRIIGRIEDAMQAVAARARELGQPVHIHDGLLQGETAATGVLLAESLLAAAPGVHVWGGETTLTLPEAPGLGGRNQHLALAAATMLRGHSDCCLLAAGTDGSDGPTTAAGALVDGATLERGETQGGSALEALARADAYPFLEASGDLIETGPTGTNVMDLMIGYRAP